MKILRFCLKIPPVKGGMEAHIYHLTKAQANKGHNVTVVFNAGEKISAYDIKFSRVKWFNMKPQFLGVIMFGIIVIFYLLLKNKKFDIVHVHGDWSSIFIARLMVFLGIAKKSALTFHGGIQNNFSHKKLLPFFVKKVFLVFSTGYESFDYLKKYNSNVHFQPSGVNSIFFEKNGENPIKKYDVISVANFVPVKNQKFIIEIAAILQDYTFLLVGTGSTVADILEEIKERGLLNINCVGFKEIREIKKLMEESKIFLLTSLEEGTPTAMMEAMALGLPIVISDVGGVSKFISEENGSILKEFNPELYSKKIKEVIENKDMYKDISNKNYTFSERFKWVSIEETITSKYE